MKIRSFLAFDIPEDVCARLAKIIDDFSRREKRIKWMRPENMHVTMRFFGSIDEELLMGDVSTVIEGVTRSASPFMLNCQGIGVFPNWKYPRVIWAGFSGDTERVIALRKDIEEALEGLGLHEDKREFRLHLTIGRTRGAIKDSPVMTLAQRLGPIRFGEVRVEGFTLYKSVLTKTGPVYTPLKLFKFRGR